MKFLGSAIASALLLTPVPTGNSQPPQTASTAKLSERIAANRAFLIGLQAAVRGNDRETVIAMCNIPLRVNDSPRRILHYNSAAVIRRDYTKIFTPKVVRSIIEQNPDDIFNRGFEAMTGNGEAWFSAKCLDRWCEQFGPVKLIAINRN